jgi:hypothetical protein
MAWLALVAPLTVALARPFRQYGAHPIPISDSFSWSTK